ncbi:MAG: SDR family oxidoreductase [Acidobacteriota bacterium]|nr:SDR family oxidoreductase [Acidobacteriota bacterium]MDQ7087401.1 SDR family oxidoreductase [Acidobacteriota bacterium]
MNTLRGKNALVCGSSRGIGRACAVALAEAGARVTLLARRRQVLEAVLAELPGQGHDLLVADCDQPESVRRTVEAYLESAPPFHVLLNNTGGPPPGEIRRARPEAFRQAFERHLVCSHLLTLLLLEGMAAEGYGRVINIISTSVRQPIPGLGVSNTIRGAVAAWAKTLAAEVASQGITVNNVLPGATDTDRLRELVDTPEKIQAWMEKIPAGRFARPEETAAAVVFLASPAAAYITGVSLPVDGGRTECL